MGGSLINHGGQNPLEAARYGCNILHGPNVLNFKEIYQFLKLNRISNKVNNEKKMINTIKKTYDDFVANNFINYDQKQIDLIEKIETIWQQNKRINFFSNTKKFKGIYVHGDVGIGKTFIINLFIQNIANAKKIHFNHLMIDLHAFINTNKKKIML